MKFTKKKTIVGAVAIGATATALLGGSYAAFNASATSSAQTIESGTVAIALQNATAVGESFVTPIDNASPGDKFTKTLKVKNTGTIAWNDVVLDFTDGTIPATLLTSDLKGFEVTITSPQDSTPATPLVANAALSTLIAAPPLALVSANGGGLDLNDLEAVDTVDLTFTYTFNAAATNTPGADFSGLKDDVAFKFDVTQRAPGTFIEASPTGSVDGKAALSGS